MSIILYRPRLIRRAAPVLLPSREPSRESPSRKLSSRDLSSRKLPRRDLSSRKVPSRDRQGADVDGTFRRHR